MSGSQLQSGSCMTISEKNINTPTEHRLVRNHTSSPVSNQRNGHIGQCYVPRCFSNIEETASDNCSGMLNSADMSPAPLRLPSNKTANKDKPELPSFPIKVYSEYIFPLPPTNMPCSDTQVNRPRSPFPPPYSTLTPPTSTSSLKETLSGNNINSLIKRPIHVVRRTQSSPDTHQVLQCKPLPKRPLAATNKGDEGVNKTWKQTIFRLTPAQNGPGSRDISTPCRTNPNANTARCQELMPRSTPHGESLRDGMKSGGGKPEEKQAKEQKYPDAKPQEIGDMGMGESNMLKIGSGCKGGGCGDRERLTPEETLWLHRNYRGEATFLKAWGLHITRNDDRERGLEIMRQLMAAEEPKGKDRRRKGQLEKQKDQIGKLKIPTPRDVDGLQAIEEERNSC